MGGDVLMYIFKNFVRSTATYWIFLALDGDKRMSFVTKVTKVWIP